MRERRYAPLDALKRITVLEAAPGGAEVNNLGAAVTWANIPIANVPTGTTSVTVALGDHVHEGTAIDATAVTDGFVLTADGAGNAAWEAAAGGGSPTALSTGTVTATTYGITSDGSADDVVLVEATTSTAGLLGSAKWNEIVANTAKVSNATHTGDVTGSTALTIAAGAVDIAMLSATGTPSASTYLRGDNTWAAPAGGSAYLVHTYVVDETSLVDSNSPVARRFFLNTHRYVMLFDLSNFTQCRLVANKQGVAGAAAYQLSVEYRAAGFSTSVANYVDIGTSAVSCACNVTNTIVDSGWINLAAGAIADSVAVCVTSEGGDGVLDPQYGSVVIQFR